MRRLYRGRRRPTKLRPARERTLDFVDLMARLTEQVRIAFATSRRVQRDPQPCNRIITPRVACSAHTGLKNDRGRQLMKMFIAAAAAAVLMAGPALAQTNRNSNEGLQSTIQQQRQDQAGVIPHGRSEVNSPPRGKVDMGGHGSGSGKVARTIRHRSRHQHS